ncbi:ABC transporter permease, partial [Candidatus Aerophobetes bacterium]
MSNRQERITELLRRIILVREAIISLIALGLVVLFYFTSFQHKFLSPDVLRTMFIAAPEIGIIVIGVTLLMIAGEFDLSVGSVSGFS